MKATCDIDYPEEFLKHFRDCDDCENFLSKINETGKCFEKNCDTKYFIKDIKRIDCSHKQHYIKEGTMFYKSSTPLHKWFYAVYLINLDKKISVKELSFKINTTYKTAWRIKKTILDHASSNDVIYKSITEKLKK